MENQKILIGLAVGLVIGAGGGYYFGQTNGFKAGKAAGRANVEQEQAKAAVTAAGSVETNPYDNVKVNPFDY